MAYPGVMDDIKKCIALQIPKRLPIIALSEEFDVRMANETYSNFDSHPDIMAKVIMETVKRFDYDWAWLQVDDCIVYEILGVGCIGGGNILRATKDYLPATSETLRSLKIPDFKNDGRAPILLEAISKVRSKLGNTVCVCGRTEAPFSSASLLYGLSQTMFLIYDNPKLLKDTCEFFIDLQIEFGRVQKEAGAHALWFGDCNASSHFLSLDHYQKFALPYANQVAKAYKEMGLITFYHASEDKLPYIELMADMDIDILSVGENANLVAAYNLVGNKKCLCGNVDPIRTLQRGTPEDVEREVKKIIDTVSRRGGHIMNSGEMIPRDTPEENMLAYMSAGRNFWKEGQNRLQPEP